jgi:heme A synthase
MTTPTRSGQKPAIPYYWQVSPFIIVGMTAFFTFFSWVTISIVFDADVSARYAFMKEVHWFLSRVGFTIALIMFGVGVYVGLIKHGDVSRWFRAATYTIFAFMLLQGAIGGIMWLMGGRPHEEVHLIYGYGVVLSLPFFIFVETTATKRPAMGSYLWGFALLAAIIIRTMSTGASA